MSFEIGIECGECGDGLWGIAADSYMEPFFIDIMRDFSHVSGLRSLDGLQKEEALPLIAIAIVRGKASDSSLQAEGVRILESLRESLFNHKGKKVKVYIISK